MKLDSQQATFCARLTPRGRGAVAVIALTGPAATPALDQHFRPINGKLFSQTAPRRIVYGVWESTGEDLVVLRTSGLETSNPNRSDQSYEIHCHGGTTAPAAIVRSLAQLNIAEQPASEFTKSQHDHWTSSIHTALSKAPTERTARIILNQLTILPAAVKEIARLIRAGELKPAKKQIRAMLAWSELSIHLTNPRTIVLCGQPNVGKSSLVNAIVGFQRAIVHSVAGTTRDVVSQLTAIDGWPVELKDTAGLRDSSDSIEAIGIEKAKAQIESADLRICVFDFSSPWGESDQQLLETIKPELIVHNKVDLPSNDERPDGIETSAETGVGIQKLIAETGKLLTPALPHTGEAVLVSQDQVNCFQQAIAILDSGGDTDAAAIAIETCASCV